MKFAVNNIYIYIVDGETTSKRDGHFYIYNFTLSARGSGKNLGTFSTWTIDLLLSLSCRKAPEDDFPFFLGG